jgi:hypothetical protein
MLSFFHPFVFVASAALLLVACSSVTGSDLEVRPIPIDSVSVTVIKTLPPTVEARVQGTLGDGCTELHSVKQERSGNVITVTILSKRPKDAICTQIAKMYEETIKLEGEFPAGSYELNVNDNESTFTVGG